MIFTRRFKPVVLDRWHAFFDDFQTSSFEFYGMVKQELARRKVPGLTMSDVRWKEGGVLSHERTYLRLTRERWVFDICAAPFGTGYLFSYRFTELPLKINAIAVLFVLCLLASIPIGAFHALRAYLDFTTSLILILVGALFGSFIFRASLGSESGGLDSMLLQLPGIGPLYDKYFRAHTYYREDTCLMYMATVPAIVKSLVAQVTVSGGVRETSTPAPKPVLEAVADAL